MSRRTTLALAGALAAPLLAACSTGSTTDQVQAQARTEVDSDAFPVTIEHAFGETTIEEEPQRIATLGWTDQDNALALGVVPVAATKLTWGGNAGGSSDWFDAAVEELGVEAPVRYDDADGAPIEDVAQAQPDVILATNSGITEAEYTKLSKIAPVVAYPEAPWTTPWQTQLEMVGQALGRTEIAADVTAETEAAIEKAAADHPQLDGASLIFGYLSTADLSTVGIYAPEDPRVSLMHDLGLVDAPVVADVVKPGEFYGSVSAEQSSELESDVFLAWSENAEDAKVFADHDLVGQIPAIAEGHVYVEDDKHVTLAVTNPSPLSIPFVLERFVPGVAAAIDGA